jgi:hypothetical protein
LAKYATYGTTESGDILQIIVWNHVPLVDEIDKIYEEWYPSEYEEVGFVNWQIMKVEEFD